MTNTAPQFKITGSEDPTMQELSEVSMALAKGAELINAAQKLHNLRRNDHRTGGYRKTYFLISFTDHLGEDSTWSGRFDLGCDSDTLQDHIAHFAANTQQQWARDAYEQVLLPAFTTVAR